MLHRVAKGHVGMHCDHHSLVQFTDGVTVPAGIARGSVGWAFIVGQ